MIAILIADRLYPYIPRQTAGPERLLPPLVDRPFIQHVLETIIEAGAEEINIILSQASMLVSEAFGNGTRWGVDLRYYYFPHGANPYEAIGAIQTPRDDANILLAHADSLPDLKLQATAEITAPVFFCWKDNGTSRWTGWAILQAGDIEKMRTEAGAKELSARRYFESDVTGCFPLKQIRKVPRPLLLASYADLIESHVRVLGKQHEGLLITGRELASGVRIGRNVTIHRTSRLTAPVFIGENSRIAEHCHIGPGASIGRDCIVESRTSIEDSVVCAGSYVGEGLDLRQVFVDGRRLVNARLKAEVENVDELLLGKVYGAKRSAGRKMPLFIR